MLAASGDMIVHLLRRLLTLLILLLLPLATSAQDSGSESVFRSQLIELHGKAIAILDRVEKMGPRESSRQDIRDEVFALVRLIHRLDEEAGATNLQLVRRNQPSSKTLLLVQQAAKAVDGMLSALDNYIESQDRAFLGFAKDNNALVWSVRKVL
jgi:hypothetical protein